MTMKEQTETLSFQAEVQELLHLVAHALYSNKEIFLRELISNASDANDKLRYAALSDSALYENDPDLKIWVDFDKETHTITVRDNGIGLTREEAIENLGTIAKSGTRAFREMLSGDQAKDSKLIGQFGVGFYSSFILADKVVVKSRHAGTNPDQGIWWESDGKGAFTIKNIERPQRGTEVVLHLKKDEDEWLDAYRLRTLIQKYSDHILFPIYMKKMELDEKQKENSTELEMVNRANALWALPKEEIKEEEYKELYKHIAHDFEEPLAWTHNRVEGALEYINLLYIPARAPLDLYHMEFRHGLKLYVKRVFIMDDPEKLMPRYLRFTRGIIDSNDLPLNISREILQSNKIVDNIRSGCVKRVLALLEKMASDEPEKYTKFWSEFGPVLKEGPAEDFSNRDRIAKLLRFASTHEANDTQNVSLADYISRMQSGQDKIYYLIADSYNAAKNSPLLELFRKKGIEVILMSDRVDEWLVAHLREYEGKQFQSVAQGALDLGSLEDTETKQATEKKEKEFDDLLKQIKEALNNQVKEVRITHRLTDSPVCVVFDEQGMSGHLQRLLKSTGQAVPETLPILELNPDHPIVLKIKNEADQARLKRWSEVLLNQALLAEGEQIKDPAGFVKQLNELLQGL